MKTLRHRIPATLVASIAFVLSQAVFAASGATAIAGRAAHERPANAPRLTADAPLDRTQALHGVSEPLPPGLKFLDRQGGWYTPFTRPGMPGPYDLRGWHSNPSTSRLNKK